MKKILSILLAVLMTLGLSGCALFEFLHDGDNIVNLGDGKTAVKWHLVSNDNALKPVSSAYFEFDQTSFKYYENGVLKKEGTHRITYFGLENSNKPLHFNLNFGKDENGFSVYDYIDCYTEDNRKNLHQFTIISQGYHIEPLRSGGVPVRDYHLSDMPYALGTYLKEGTEQYSYQNERVNYLECANLQGTFLDENGNSFYFVNNSYSTEQQTTNYSPYTVYMRYENNQNNSFLEGTIKMSWHEDWDTGERINVALIHVMRGENEPGQEKGTYAEPDYSLIAFNLGDNCITFSSGDYFYENRECDYNPANFVAGTYYKTNIN